MRHPTGETASSREPILPVARGGLCRSLAGHPGEFCVSPHKGEEQLGRECTGLDHLPVRQNISDREVAVSQPLQHLAQSSQPSVYRLVDNERPGPIKSVAEAAVVKETLRRLQQRADARPLASQPSFTLVGLVCKLSQSFP